jgi:hypothetical protein
MSQVLQFSGFQLYCWGGGADGDSTGEGDCERSYPPLNYFIRIIRSLSRTSAGPLGLERFAGAAYLPGGDRRGGDDIAAPQIVIEGLKHFTDIPPLSPIKALASDGEPVFDNFRVRRNNGVLYSEVAEISPIGFDGVGREAPGLAIPQKARQQVTGSQGGFFGYFCNHKSSPPLFYPQARDKMKLNVLVPYLKIGYCLVISAINIPYFLEKSSPLLRLFLWEKVALYTNQLRYQKLGRISESYGSPDSGQERTYTPDQKAMGNYFESDY